MLGARFVVISPGTLRKLKKYIYPHMRHCGRRRASKQSWRTEEAVTDALWVAHMSVMALGHVTSVMAWSPRNIKPGSWQLAVAAGSWQRAISSGQLVLKPEAARARSETYCVNSIARPFPLSLFFSLKWSNTNCWTSFLVYLDWVWDRYKFSEKN